MLSVFVYIIFSSLNSCVKLILSGFVLQSVQLGKSISEILGSDCVLHSYEQIHSLRIVSFFPKSKPRWFDFELFLVNSFFTLQPYQVVNYFILHRIARPSSDLIMQLVNVSFCRCISRFLLVFRPSTLIGKGNCIVHTNLVAWNWYFFLIIWIHLFALFGPKYQIFINSTMPSSNSFELITVSQVTYATLNILRLKTCSYLISFIQLRTAFGCRICNLTI